MIISPNNVEHAMRNTVLHSLLHKAKNPNFLNERYEYFVPEKHKIRVNVNSSVHGGKHIGNKKSFGGAHSEH